MTNTSGADRTWSGWVYNSGTTSTNIYTTANAAWGGWNVRTAGPAPTAQYRWDANPYPSNPQIGQPFPVYLPTFGRTMYGDWGAADDATRKEREAKTQEALAKSKALLEEFLSVADKEAMDRLGTLEVRSQSGRRFRLYPRVSSNVGELAEDGRYLGHFCIIPTEPVPQYDHWLAEKLMLETDEAAFFSIAQPC